MADYDRWLYSQLADYEKRRDACIFNFDEVPDGTRKALMEMWESAKQDFLYNAEAMLGVDSDCPNYEDFKEGILDAVEYDEWR